MGEREIGTHSDVRALGTVVHEMLWGDPPWADEGWYVNRLRAGWNMMLNWMEGLRRIER